MGYPMMLDISGRNVTVVGGGTVATRRIGRLLQAGACVRVVTLQASSEIERWSERGQVELYLHSYRAEDLAGAELVLATTNDPDVNAQIAEDAKKGGIWSNIAGEPELGDFTVPAVASFPCLQLAIHAAGTPALARALRQELEESLAPGWYRGAALLTALRPHVRKLGDVQARNQFWGRLVAALPHAAEAPSPSYVEWIERAAAESGLLLERGLLEDLVDRTFRHFDTGGGSG